jgi:molybdopterin synthase catalytic subunit
MRVALRDAPIHIDEAIAEVAASANGGLALFLGVVRDESDGHVVTRLEYSAYRSMAEREMDRIAGEIERANVGVKVCVIHRLGSLTVGETAVVCAAGAPHRREAFQACRALIDAIKERIPIWKREHGPDGTTWVGWVDARCTHDHADATHRQRVE